MAKAFQSLGISVLDRGVFFQSQESTQSNTLKETPINSNQLVMFVKGASESGEYYLAMLRDFLMDKADTYEEIVRTSGDAFNRDNTDKTTFWV